MFMKWLHTALTVRNKHEKLGGKGEASYLVSTKPSRSFWANYTMYTKKTFSA
jgi:hypothetical protein